MKQESSGLTPDEGAQPETLQISETNPILNLIKEFPHLLIGLLRKNTVIDDEITQEAESIVHMSSKSGVIVDPRDNWMENQGWQG